MFDNAGVHVVATASLSAPRDRRGDPRRPRRRLPASVRRSTQHGLVVAAVALTVLLCATALATVAALTGSSVRSEGARRLAAQIDAQVSVAASFKTEGMATADRDVRAAAARVFAGAPQQTYVGLLDTGSVTVVGINGVAGAPTVPGAGRLHPVAAQGGGDFGQLVGGHWPAGTANAPASAFTALPSVRIGTGSIAPVDAAVPESLALRLGLKPGSSLRLSAAGRTTTLRISGVFRASGAAGFWPAMAGDLTEDETASQDLLVVTPAALNGNPVLNGQLVAHWSVQPDFSGLGTGRLHGLRDRVRAFTGSQSAVSVFRGKPPTLDEMSVSSGLAQAVDDLAIPTVVARSALYQPSVMLAALALATLILAGRQMTVRRRAELALQQARGSGTPRLLRAAAAEWALTGVPAAVAAPFLADLLHHGTSGTGAAWLAVSLTLLVHAVSVLLPVLPAMRWRAARGARSAVAQRLGVDLALLAVAVLGFLELRRHSSVVGGTSVDPVLVFVPAVASGAAALLLLRLLPLTSLLLDVLGRRSRGLVGALAGWQLSRRTARNAGPVVLMCLAVSVSAFATTALACLGGLAAEQAAYTVGADVRIEPSADDSYPSAVLAAAYHALPAVTAVTPVIRGSANLPSGSTEELIGTVAGPAPRTGPVSALGIALPGRPAALLLDERLSSNGSTAAPHLELTLQDAAGLVSTVTTALPAADGGRHNVAVPLDVSQSGGHPRAYPLTVTAVSVMPQADVAPARLDLDVIRVGSRGAVSASGGKAAGADTWAAPLPAGQSWADGTDHAADATTGACKGKPYGEYQFGAPGVCSISHGGSDVLRTSLSTGFTGYLDGTGLAADDVKTLATGNLRFVARPAGAPKPLPVRADAQALDEGHLSVGSTTSLDLGTGTPLPARIVGELDSLRGLGHGQGHLVADQRQLAAAIILAGALQQDPAFWWISSNDSVRTAAAAQRQPALGAVTTTTGTAKDLRSDPFRTGLHRMLELIRYLAPCFAVIAFTVHAVVSTRQRRQEFALLRAMGVRSRKLSVLLSAEHLSLALFAVVPGALMGMALASVMLPLITVDDAGQAPYPALPLVMPWRTVAVTAVLTALAIAAVVLTLSRLLARVDLVRVLRAGEDR
jgi:hypothetical protein